MRASFVVIFIICQVSKSLLAQPLVLSKSYHQVIDLSGYLSLFVDTSKQLTLKQIHHSHIQGQFVQNKQGNTNLGRGIAVWLKFTLKGEPGQYLLEVNDGLLTSLEFYHPKPNGGYKQQTRNVYQTQALDATNILFPITLNNRLPHTFYIRCYAKSSLWIPVSVGTKEAFINKNHWQDLYQGAFFGCLLIMLVYNLLIYLQIRDLSYLYYITYLGSLTVYLAMITGYSTEFLWPQHPHWNNYNFVLFVFFSVSLVLFSNYFLHTKQHAPRLYQLSKFLIGFVVFSGLVGFFNRPLSQSMQQIYMLLSFPLFVIMGLTVRKKYRLANLYLTGWGGLFISTFLLIMSNIGVLKFNFTPLYLVELGVLVELVIFSFALAARIKYYQQENHRLVSEQKEHLAQKVAEKTQELRIINDELLTNNEELLQAQEEIATQRDAIAEQNLLVAKSISAAQKIQQAALPFTSRINRILPEHFILFRPRDIVSGDFYWIEKVEDKVFVATLDCTGHGVPGAFMSMIANMLLDNIIKINKINEPVAILDQLQQRVRVALRQDETNDRSGMDIALVALQTKANKETSLCFTGAKLPLYCLKPGDDALTILKGTRKGIGGIQPPDVVFESHQVHLPKRSILYLSTDGFEDQNDSRRKKIGSKGLQKLLLSNAHLSMKSQKEALEKVLNTHMENTRQRDDILVMGIRLD